MSDYRLREIFRPVANAMNPKVLLDAQRRAAEGFRDDGKLERRVIAEVLPLQRIDWIVAPSAAAVTQVGRFYVPETAKAVRLALVSTANVGSTFVVDVMVNGVARASGSIRAGSSSMSGGVSIDLPAASVVSLVTKSSVPQGVTVSLFYRLTED